MIELTFVNFRSKAEVFVPVDASRYANFCILVFVIPPGPHLSDLVFTSFSPIFTIFSRELRGRNVWLWLFIGYGRDGSSKHWSPRQFPGRSDNSLAQTMIGCAP